MPAKPNSKQLFDMLCQIDRVQLPTIHKEIANLGSIFNAKDRLNELCVALATLVRYVVLRDAEHHEVDLGNLPITIPPDHAAAQQPTAAFPASGAIAFPQPQARPASSPIPATLDVTVGSGIMPATNIHVGADTEIPDPEPSNVIQTVITRGGGTKVIPPVGSRAPVRVFGPGQPVDTTYIAAIDSAPTGDGAPSAG
jgi:hypothetical protein